MNNPDEVLYWVFPVKSYRVIDGDNVECTFDRGWRDDKTLNVRLWGIDAPEDETSSGRAVEKVLELWLAPRASSLSFHSIAEDKYSTRGLGDLFPKQYPWETATSFLMEYQLCREYKGGKKEPWPEGELAAIEERCQGVIEEKLYEP